MAVQMNLYMRGAETQTQNNGTEVTSDVSGLETYLQSAVSLTVEYNCVHVFGGIRCGANLISQTGYVISQTNTSIEVQLDSATTLNETRLQFGTIRILNGSFAGMEMSVESASIVNPVVTFTVRGSLPANLVGKSILFCQGCAKTYPACQENGNDRFVGFPQVPGASRAYTVATTI